MTATRKWIYGIVGLAVFFVLLNFVLQSWLKSKLPEVFQKNTDYELQFEDINISLFRSSLSLEKVTIQPQSILAEKLSDSLTVNIKGLEINGINLFKLLFKEDIAISNIKINEPQIYYSKFFEKQKDTISSKSERQRNISIKFFEIEQGKLMFSNLQQGEFKTLEVENVNIKLENIQFNQETSLDKIPFMYDDVALKIGSVNYHPSSVYHLKTEQIS